LVAGLRVCSRGAQTGDQVCGNLNSGQIDITTPIDVNGRRVRNQFCWSPDPGVDGLTFGDSGAPLYRVQSDESVWAAGLVASSLIDIEPVICFTSMGAVLNQTNTTLKLAN